MPACRIASKVVSHDQDLDPGVCGRERPDLGDASYARARAIQEGEDEEVARQRECKPMAMAGMGSGGSW